MRTRGFLAVALATWLTSSCTPHREQPSTTSLRIVSTSGDLSGSLARLYNQQIPGLVVTAALPEAARYNLAALDEGKADIGLVRADIVYLAFGSGTDLRPRPHSRLRGLAVVGTNVLHIVATEASVQTLADLRGRRIGLLGASPEAVQRLSSRIPGIGVELYSQLLGATGKLSEDDFQSMPATSDDLARALVAGDVPAAVFLAPYPAPFATRLARAGHMRLIDIVPEDATRVRERHRFFKPVVIPPGTYEGQHKAVNTIGVDMLLVCREDLAEELVYTLVKTLFESARPLAETSESVSTMDADLAAATPIALHPGAARYYRERELPPH